MRQPQHTSDLLWQICMIEVAVGIEDGKPNEVSESEDEEGGSEFSARSSSSRHDHNSQFDTPHSYTQALVPAFGRGLIGRVSGVKCLVYKHGILRHAREKTG